MMLEPVGEEDEADLLRQDDEANQSGWLLLSSLSSYFDPLWGHPQRMYAQRGGRKGYTQCRQGGGWVQHSVDAPMRPSTDRQVQV